MKMLNCSFRAIFKLLVLWAESPMNLWHHSVPLSTISFHTSEMFQDLFSEFLSLTYLRALLLCRRHFYLMGCKQMLKLLCNLYLNLHRHILWYKGSTPFIWLNVSKGTSGSPTNLHVHILPDVSLDRLGHNTCIFKTASLNPNSRG